MKSHRTEIALLVSLLAAGFLLYAVRWSFFPGPALHNEMWRFLVGDIAFLFLQVAIVTLVLMCHEFVSDSRAELWQVGGTNGWNSDPSMRIYFYANHEEPPEIPLIWSQR